MIYPKKGMSYRTVSVDTASPGKLILMLYDGALRFLKEGELGFEEECPRVRNETISNNLIKVQNILAELQRSLNFDASREFAERMYSLYEFMINQCQESNVHKKVEPIHVVQRLLGEIRDAWAEMLANQGTHEISKTGLSLSA